MDIYLFFENMNVLCIFAQLVFLFGLFSGFCSVLVWFRFLGLAGSTSGLVLITFLVTHTIGSHFLGLPWCCHNSALDKCVIPKGELDSSELRR